MIVTYPVSSFVPDAPETEPGLSEMSGFISGYGAGYRTMPGLRNLSTSISGMGGTSFYYTGLDGLTQYLYCRSSSTGRVNRANIRAATPFAAVTGSPVFTGDTHYIQWGNDVIVSDGFTAPYYHDTTLNTFSPMIVGTKVPLCPQMTICFNHLVVGGQPFQGGVSPHDENKVFWSAFDNPTNFDDSIVTGAGEQRILDVPGPVTGLVGGESVLVFKERGVSLMTYEGSPYTFAIRTISDTFGTLQGSSIVQKGNSVYFFGSDGFKRIVNRSYIEDIGQGKVESFIRCRDGSNAFFQDGSISKKLVGAYDHASGLIVWMYTSRNSPVEGNCLITYDDSRDVWSFYRNDSVSIQSICTGPYVDFTTWNTEPLSSIPMVTKQGAAYFGSAFSSITSTSPYSCKTKRITLSEDSAIFVRAVRLLVKVGDGTSSAPAGTYTVDLSNDPFFASISSSTTVSTVSSNGWVPILRDGQFARIKYEGAADTTANRYINELIAFQLDVEQSGSIGA